MPEDHIEELRQVIRSNDLVRAKELLDGGVSALSRVKGTPVVLNCESTAMARLLEERGADLAATCEKGSNLLSTTIQNIHWATDTDRSAPDSEFEDLLDLVRLAVESGCPIRPDQGIHRPPLHQWAWLAPDANAYNSSPQTRALAVLRHLKLGELLIQLGADVEQTFGRKPPETPLDVARNRGAHEAREFLVSQGATKKPLFGRKAR